MAIVVTSLEHADTEGVQRSLGAFDIGCVVVGGIIGVGIFFTPARVASAVDNESQVVLAWSLGGVLAMLGALTFAGLSRCVQGHGGTFVFLEAAFGRPLAFLYGWTNWLVIQAGAAAVIALVMAEYLDRAVHGERALGFASRVGHGVLAIAAFTAINVIGLRVGSITQNVLTVAKVLAVLALGGLALLSGHEAPPPTPPTEPRGLFVVLAAAMLPVLFSFGGWQQGSFVAGAARDPRRDVPLGIVGGVAAVAIVYLAANLAMLELLGFDAARTSSAIAADATRVALGEGAARVLAIAVVVSSAGILNTICLAPPYVLHEMAKRGLFFAPVGRLHARFGTPMLGVVVQGVSAIALLTGAWLAFGDASKSVLGFLLDGVVFIDWVFYASCGFALVRLAEARGVRALGATFGISACVIAAGAVAVSWQASLVALGLCLLGVPCLAVIARQARADPS